MSKKLILLTPFVLVLGLTVGVAEAVFPARHAESAGIISQLR